MVSLPLDRAGWGRLCRVLTLGRRRVEKGSCRLTLADLLEWGAGQRLLILDTRATMQGGAKAWTAAVDRLARRFEGQCALLMAPRYDGQDARRFDVLAGLAARLDVPTVASAAPVI